MLLRVESADAVFLRPSIFFVPLEPVHLPLFVSFAHPSLFALDWSGGSFSAAAVAAATAAAVLPFTCASIIATEI